MKQSDLETGGRKDSERKSIMVTKEEAEYSETRSSTVSIRIGKLNDSERKRRNRIWKRTD
jgi:hypothetical protein